MLRRKREGSRTRRPAGIWLIAALGAATVVAVAASLLASGGGHRARAFQPDAAKATPLPTASPTPTPEATTDGYVTRVFSADGMTMTYYLHIPATAPGQHYPVVLLLHGGQEAAWTSRTPAQNANALLRNQYVDVWTSAAVQSQWPSFIVVPQAVSPNRWVNVPAGQGSYTLQSAPAPALALAKDIVTHLLATYSESDPSRVYITGISEGAYGVWDAVERWPGFFAAAMPLAGAGDPSRAAALVHTSIWDFHGSDDQNVPVSGSRDMYAAIHAAGGASCYTEFAGVTHTIWMRVYGDTNLIAWLFAQGTPTADEPGMTRCAV